jgi:hypothetical protein
MSHIIRGFPFVDVFDESDEVGGDCAHALGP